MELLVVAEEEVAESHSQTLQVQGGSSFQERERTAFLMAIELQEWVQVVGPESIAQVVLGVMPGWQVDFAESRSCDHLQRLKTRTLKPAKQKLF